MKNTRIAAALVLVLSLMISGCSVEDRSRSRNRNDNDINEDSSFEDSLREDDSIFYSEGLDIIVYNGTATVTGLGSCNDSNLVIPPYASTGEPITRIDGGAFASAAIESVSIPETVETIGYSAFEGCTNLESVDFSNGLLWIRSYAFRGCDKLESIDVPNSVTQIDVGAFAGCNSLNSINLPESFVIRIENIIDGGSEFDSATNGYCIFGIGSNAGTIIDMSGINQLQYINGTDAQNWLRAHGFSGESETDVIE